MLYGSSPFADVTAQSLGLRPAMTLRSEIIGVQTLQPGDAVGYGASFGGLAALLGMLNSCAAGVSVVNIDNGFGAAHVALRILNEEPRSPAAQENVAHAAGGGTGPTA